MSDNNPERQFALPSAAYYFKASRTAQAAGQLATAVLLMENAFNHTENALFALCRETGEEFPSAFVDRLERLGLSALKDGNKDHSAAFALAAREVRRLLLIAIHQEGLLRKTGHPQGAVADMDPRRAEK